MTDKLTDRKTADLSAHIFLFKQPVRVVCVISEVTIKSNSPYEACFVLKCRSLSRLCNLTLSPKP